MKKWLCILIFSILFTGFNLSLFAADNDDLLNDLDKELSTTNKKTNTGSKNTTGDKKNDDLLDELDNETDDKKGLTQTDQNNQSTLDENAEAGLFSQLYKNFQGSLQNDNETVIYTFPNLLTTIIGPNNQDFIIRAWCIYLRFTKDKHQKK